MKNSLLCTLSTLFVLLFLASCQMGPQNKAQYIEQYGQFLDKIKERKETPNDKQWEALDNEFEKWSDTYYEQYKEELTFGEKLQVKGYGVAYRALRGVGKLQSSFTIDSEDSKELEAFVEKTGKNLEEAFEDFTHDAEDELDGLGEVLEKLGNKVEDAVNGFTHDAEDELDDLEVILEKLGEKAEDAADNFSDDAENELEGLGEVLEKLGGKIEKAAESFAKKIEKDAEELEEKLNDL